MNEKTHVIHRSLFEKMEMEAVLNDDDDDDAKKKKKKKKKKGENQSRIIARLDSRMMLSSKKSGRLALGGDTGTFGERKTRRMSTPAPSCPDERWVYSSAFAEEEEVETRAKTPPERRKSCAFANGGGGASKKTRAESLVESVDVIRDLFQRNKRDIGRVEDVTRTKLPEKKLLMLESTTRKSTGSSNDTSTNNRFREDKEGDLHRKEERRRRFAKAEREEYSRRGWKKLVRTKVGGDGLYVKGRGKETPNTLTWESLKRVRKLWREYAAKELEERRKEQKKNVSSSSKKTTTLDEHVDGISERDRKEKDAWELFGAVVLVTKHRKANLVGESGVVIRETKTNVHVLRKTEVSSLLVIPKTPGAELSIPVSRKEMGEEDDDDDDDDDDERVIRISY
tara:strand:- start:4896 stop:6083 length:1188 start_codon:yes stop_codon:yes gene_type:complete